MKLKKAFLLACSVFAFTACGGDDDGLQNVNYLPGEIPGLGETPGDLTGTPFVLPDGIELQGSIKGYSGSIYSSNSIDAPARYPDIFATKEAIHLENHTTLRASDTDIIVGSGRFVDVFFVLANKNNRDTEVTFPAGLIVLALSSSYQNGVLLKKTSVTVPKNGTLRMVLIMYCGNADLSPSSSSQEYKLQVVTDADLLLDLCDRLKNKKINYEEFEQADRSIFNNQCSTLQGMLWSLTDPYAEGGLTDEDKKWIDNLPNSK